MTSLNYVKDVKISQIPGQKAKTYYIELYKTLEARLSVESDLGARTGLLCQAWRRVHSLCQHSALSTHPHLISWLQRHTAQTILQSEWRQLSINRDKHEALGAAIDFFIAECREAAIARAGAPCPQWEVQLAQRAEWFKTVIEDPWGNAVLKALLDRSGEAPTDEHIVEWLREERGVFFVTRLRQLAASRRTADIALSLAAAVMERARAGEAPEGDLTAESATAKDVENIERPPTFKDILTKEAGFTVDVWELITDIEFVLVYSDRSKCITLAKQTPLKNGYQLVERLHSRLDISSREKRLWKNAKEVAILIAQVIVARCMVAGACAGAARSALYGCARSLARLLPADRLPAAMAALAAPAATARHLHTLAAAIDAQCKDERKPFVCELYIRAITAGMNELERLKLNKDKEKEWEARAHERTLGAWFTSLGALLAASARLANECALTAFSLHPSLAMYERVRDAPPLQPLSPAVKDNVQEAPAEAISEFGSWANDSRSKTNLVKTSETLNMKKIQQHSNVLSTAVLNEGEALGLSPELCQDLIVLLSGPRVKTLSWDMDKDVLIENCRSYMERTHGGTRALTTELKYLNLHPDSFMHLPEEEDEDESNIYYGIEKGYEHLVELQEPEEIWEDAFTDLEATESCYSTENEMLIPIQKIKKKGKVIKYPEFIDKDAFDPLGDSEPKFDSNEGNDEPIKERRKERSKERKKKERQPRVRSSSTSKSKSKKENEKTKTSNEGDLPTFDSEKSLHKLKKERKKREKKEKNKSQKSTPSVADPSVLNENTIQSNFQNSNEQEAKPETDINNQLFINDSDYDSQGKSSVASLHTEGNDPDVLFDGLFCMDYIKSPEKPSVIKSGAQKINIKQDLSTRKCVTEETSNVTAKVKISNSSLLSKPIKLKSVEEYSHFPSDGSYETENYSKDDIKLGIKRLMQFRKQKSAIDLHIKPKQVTRIDQQADDVNVKKHVTDKRSIVELLNSSDNRSRAMFGSPKAVSVPDIPKVFINKQQSQQLNQLKSEIDTYLLNNNHMETQKYSFNNLPAKPDLCASNEHIEVKSDTNLNNFEHKLNNVFDQCDRSNVATNALGTTLVKGASSNKNQNIAGRNVSVSSQNTFNNFFKELHHTINAGVSKDVKRVSGLSISKHPRMSTIPKNCAKEIKSSKKVENVPNTFARRNYMHKNKQGDNTVSKQNNHPIQSTLKKCANPQPVRNEDDIINTLLSRIDCTVIRKPENSPHRKGLPLSTSIVDVNKSVIKKTVSKDDRLVLKSNTLHSPQTSSQTSTSFLNTSMLTSRDEEQIRHLLRQQIKFNEIRPQIRPELVMNKGFSNTLPCKDSLQSVGKPPVEEVHSRLQSCPTKLQDNTPVAIQNCKRMQLNSSHIKKIKETAVKRHKSPIVNTKRSQSENKPKIVQQDWESVLNDLLSHKTPCRDPNMQSKVIRKEKKLMDINSLHEQKITNLKTSNSINSNVIVGSNINKKPEDFNTKTVVKQNKCVLEQKSRNMTLLETNAKTALNNIPTLKNDHICTNINTSSVIKQPSMIYDDSSLKKLNQPAIIRRPNKTPDVKLPTDYSKKELNSSVQPHINSIITNIPSSEYDILGELMDDELRKEIGELSSDEENFSTTNTISRGNKVKIVSNKLVRTAASIYSNTSFSSNINQVTCTSSKETVPILQPESTMATSTVNAIKSKPLHNTILKQDIGKSHAIMQQEKARNPNHQGSKIIMPSHTPQQQGQPFLNTNSSISNQTQTVNTPFNRVSLDHNVLQTNINTSYKNVTTDNLRLSTCFNQTRENGLSALCQQHPVLRNVLLVRPEIVYEPYAVQVHPIPETIHSNVCNLDANTFVAVNAVPTASMFGANLTRPGMNPIIISKTVTVPINMNSASSIINTCNNNEVAYNNALNSIVDGSNRKEFENVQYHNVENTTPSSELQFLSDKSIRCDHVINNIPQKYVKNNDLSSNNAEKKVFTEVRKTANLPFNTRNGTEAILSGHGHINNLNNIEVEDIKKDVPSHLLLLNSQHMELDNVVNNHVQSDKPSSDCMSNTKSEINRLPVIQDNRQRNESSGSLRCAENEKPSAVFSHRNNSFDQNKPKRRLSPIEQKCTRKNQVAAAYSNPIVKVNDCMLDMVAKRNLNSREQECFSPAKPSEAPTSINQEMISVLSRCSSNDYNTIPRDMITRNSHSSSQPSTKIVDKVIHLAKTDNKLNDGSCNKNDRKVLSEVQEKHTIVLPEKTISKPSIDIENENKEFLKAQDERVKRKKTAILNRQVHIFSDVKPIPLTYAPISSFKEITDNDERHNDVKTSISDSIKIANISKDSADYTADKIVADCYQLMLKDGSKENNKTDAVQRVRLRLRSSNKAVDNSSIAPQNHKVGDNIKNRAKPKMKNVKDRTNTNINKPRGTKRLEVVNTENIGRPFKTLGANDNQNASKNNIVDVNPNIDVIKQLQESVPKKDLLSEEAHTTKEIYNTYKNIETKITLGNESDKIVKKVTSVTDQMLYKIKANEIQSDKPCIPSVVISERPEIIKNDSPLDTEKLNDCVQQIGEKKEIDKKLREPIKQKLLCKIKTNHENIGNESSSSSQGVKSQQDVLDRKKVIDSLKDIILEELPRKKGDDPLKRCISIKLANGNSFKATVSGKLQIDINSLFDDPAIRSILMKNIPSNTKCILNIQQVTSASGENVKTRLVQPEIKLNNLETINLISDDEEDSETGNPLQMFNTEFGKYKVRSLNNTVFNKHQLKLSQKCSVRIQKCTFPGYKAALDLVKKIHEIPSTAVTDGSITEQTLPSVEDSIENKDLQVIEIKDSSSDSAETDCLINEKTLSQPLNTSEDMELNIKELKETLLKDLCVDMNNKLVHDTNLPQLNVPDNIEMNVKNLKETLLKDLCVDLENTDEEKATVTGTCDARAGKPSNTSPNFSTENLRVESTREHSINNDKSVCKAISSINKDQKIVSDSERISTVTPIKIIAGILPESQNKFLTSKTCQVKIDKCDDLVRKYQLLKNKKCFVSLERCDLLIQSHAPKYDKNIPVIKNLPLTGSKSVHIGEDLEFITELETSQCILKRSGSFSILNDINLYDQSEKLLTPTDSNTLSQDKEKGNGGKNYKNGRDIGNCNSDWRMTKLEMYFIVKGIQHGKILSDDISTDYESDLEENYKTLSEIHDCVDTEHLPVQDRFGYQVPSLLQIIVKLLEETTVCNTDSSSHQLKRKLSFPENVLNDRKLMKLDNGIRNSTSPESIHVQINNDNIILNGLDVIKAPANTKDKTRSCVDGFQHHSRSPYCNQLNQGLENIPINDLTSDLQGDDTKITLENHQKIINLKCPTDKYFKDINNESDNKTPRKKNILEEVRNKAIYESNNDGHCVAENLRENIIAHSRNVARAVYNENDSQVNLNSKHLGEKENIQNVCTSVELMASSQGLNIVLHSEVSHSTKLHLRQMQNDNGSSENINASNLILDDRKRLPSTELLQHAVTTTPSECQSKQGSLSKELLSNENRRCSNPKNTSLEAISDNSDIKCKERINSLVSASDLKQFNNNNSNIDLIDETVNNKDLNLLNNKMDKNAGIMLVFNGEQLTSKGPKNTEENLIELNENQVGCNDIKQYLTLHDMTMSAEVKETNYSDVSTELLRSVEEHVTIATIDDRKNKGLAAITNIAQVETVDKKENLTKTDNNVDILASAVFIEQSACVDLHFEPQQSVQNTIINTNYVEDIDENDKEKRTDMLSDSIQVEENDDNDRNLTSHYKGILNLEEYSRIRKNNVNVVNTTGLDRGSVVTAVDAVLDIETKEKMFLLKPRPNIKSDVTLVEQSISSIDDRQEFSSSIPQHVKFVEAETIKENRSDDEKGNLIFKNESFSIDSAYRFSEQIDANVCGNLLNSKQCNLVSFEQRNKSVECVVEENLVIYDKAKCSSLTPSNSYDNCNIQSNLSSNKIFEQSHCDGDVKTEQYTSGHIKLFAEITSTDKNPEVSIHNTYSICEKSVNSKLQREKLELLKVASTNVIKDDSKDKNKADVINNLITTEGNENTSLSSCNSDSLHKVLNSYHTTDSGIDTITSHNEIENLEKQQLNDKGKSTKKCEEIITNISKDILIAQDNIIAQDNMNSICRRNGKFECMPQKTVTTCSRIQHNGDFLTNETMHVESHALSSITTCDSKGLRHGCRSNPDQFENDCTLFEMPSKNCANDKYTNKAALIPKAITNSNKNRSDQNFIENRSTEKECSISNEDKTNKDSKSIRNKVDKNTYLENITYICKSDSNITIKGSVIKNPVRTGVAFPIMNHAKRPIVIITDCIVRKATSSFDRQKLFKNTDLIVIKPKVSYSNLNLLAKNRSCRDRLSSRGLKRKMNSTDSSTIQKKYRKGPNIDQPKPTAAAMSDSAYRKEFKNLITYCSSVKFSYTKHYHLMQLDEVHSMLKDWPIKESILNVSDASETEGGLFVDTSESFPEITGEVLVEDLSGTLFQDKQRTLPPDPSRQTLSEEISALYEDSRSTSPIIMETNFSMGFGEGSDRVNQNLINGVGSTEISAVTLSDVKQSQPFLQYTEDKEFYNNEAHIAKQKQLQILDKCYSLIRLRNQVKSFFSKTTAELNYSWLKRNIKSEKKESDFNSLFDMNDSSLFLDTDFFEPPFTENIVQVVQVGQLPVSAGAQNPVTCDQRVTQVSDASPPQCSVDNISNDDMEPSTKNEYTELRTADISLPLITDYDQHHQGLISASQNSDIPANNDNITIETEVKIEVLEEVTDSTEEQGRYDSKDFITFQNDQITNTEYSFDVNNVSVPIKNEPVLEPVKIVLEPIEPNVGPSETPVTYESHRQPQQNGSTEKPDQLAHAMNAAGISTTEPVSDTAEDLSNSLCRSVCPDMDSNHYQRSNITTLTLQQALAQILPSSLNPSSELENNPQVSVGSQILHIVQGNNTVNHITHENTQQSVISTATSTPVLHIVQNKNVPTSSSSNDSPVPNSNSFSGLSLVDGGMSQGGNQFLHIVNTSNQKSNNSAQLLKRVNLLTNLTNVQGSNEQKMVQFVCKSDSKGIQLNTQQRSMVLRLHTIESPQSVPLKPESSEPNSTIRESPTKESVAPQELKSRSVYEENYAKFIQKSNKQPVIEKATSLPKFNQAFGKPVFQEENQKSNNLEVGESHLSSEDTNVEANDGQSSDHPLHLENIRQIASPPLLLRKASHTVAQQNIVQQIKQAITPMNIQTMHGGVIYTRQIPVNIGGGQTINLITVPSTEITDDSGQKQKDVKFGNRSDIEPSIIKIVPQNTVTSNSEIATDESNNTNGVSNESNQNSQPPMLTQMRIKLPMLSKNSQIVSGARVVRPSFFQIQRNVIGGPNQPVYQQLVLTAAPTLGQQSIRLPQAQTSRESKVGSESQTAPESQLSSSTLEQLREFDMVLEQVKERSIVQPNGTPGHDFPKANIPSTNTTDRTSRPSEVTQQVLYSIGNNQSVNVAYVNRKSTVVSATTSFARSADSSNIAESSSSSTHAPSTSDTTNGSQPAQNHHKSHKVRSKSRPKSHHPPFKFNHIPPKPNQKPMEDEQTTQRILYILAEYKEQVENSPDKDKPAPRRRTNLQASILPGGSKRKKSSSGSRRSGRDSSPLDDNCRTMGSEDSSCGASQGDCSETYLDTHSPQGSPRKVAKKLSFEQDSPVSQSRPQHQQPQPQQPQAQQKQVLPQFQRNVLVTDGPTIAVTRATPGKPATAVLMPANYILPVSMVKSGQQIAIVTNRGPKILTVGGGESGTTNALLLQRLITPSGLKPMLARPGVRHVRLPTTALHNLQAFNLAPAATAQQPTDAASSPTPETSPPELVDSKAPRSPWTAQQSEEVKPDQETQRSSPEQEPEQEQEPERETEPEPVQEPEQEPDPDPEPWNVVHDYSYEETVRTEMDRTVLDAIPDRYSPDMEAQRIFDKMFDVESKKVYIDSQDDSTHCPYDIDASDCDDKAYHQVLQRRDGTGNRHRFVSTASLRQKLALMEDELRLQKSLSEECEDLGVDSPSASDLFPEAELLFSSSPAHEASHQPHTPQPVILNQSSGIPKPDLEDHTATDHVIARADRRPEEDIDLGLEDVGIVTVSEDGMRATIALDHEEFVRSHPNTTFHSELTDEGEVQPVTLADLKARHITSTIFHAGRAPPTVLVTAPQTTVISQATPDGAGVAHLRCSHADTIKDDPLNRFDMLNEPRELLGNGTSAIIHSTGNTTQVIRRVGYDDVRDARYLLDDDPKLSAEDDGDMDDCGASPERHAELFWDTSARRDFGSDSDKCCKSPDYENNSTDSTVGVNMRLDSVIKDARGLDPIDDILPPLRTYPPKRTYEAHDRSLARAKAEDRSAEGSEGRRRASNRGVVKRGCHCCNGSPAPPKKKPRQRKPTLDWNN